MPDFNNKKEILRRLRAKRNNNKALWLPCAAAELCVKAWYAAVCRLGLIFSDRNGRFLGVGQAGEKPKTRRKDDIVYVKKPFLGRVLSALLAASFVMMFVPELDMSVFAALPTVTVDGIVYEAYAEEGVQLSENLYYQSADRTAALNATVTIGTSTNAYGAFQVTWADVPSADGFYIDVYEEGTHEQAIPQRTAVKGTTRTMISGLANDPNTAYEVKVTPYTNVKLYKWTPPTLQNPDDPNSPISVPGVMTELQGRSFPQIGTGGTKEVGTLDCALENPVIEKPVKYDNNITATLEWNHVQQVSGTDMGKYADGYIIYARTVNGETSEATEYNQIATVTEIKQGVNLNDGKISLDVTVRQGMIYEFYAVAYRSAFGSKGYNEDNPGLITSGRENPPKPVRLVTTPTRPYPVGVESNRRNALTVKWNHNAGNRTGYIIYRSEKKLDEASMKDYKDANGNNPYYDADTKEWDYSRYVREQAGNGNVDTVNADTTEIVDDADTLINSKVYYYYVMPYLTIDSSGSAIYGIPAEMSGSIGAKINPPSEIYTVSSDGQIVVNWSPVDNADGYIISIKKELDADGNPVAENPVIINWNGTTYTHTTYNGRKLLNGEKYTYSVKAYLNVKTESSDKLISDGDISATDSVGVPLKIPQGLTATAADGMITITWEPVDGAEGYRLYYKLTTKEGVEYDYSDENVFDVGNATTKIHRGLRNGDKYTYKVRAYKNVNGKDEPGPMSKDEAWAIVGIPLDAPKDLEGIVSDGQIDLSWSESEGAEGYILYIYKDGNLNGTPVKVDLSDTEYSHTNLKNNEVYSYKVVAYKNVNGEPFYGPESNIITRTVGIPLNKPMDFTGIMQGGVVTLNWSDVDDAAGYTLHITVNGSSWEVDLSEPGYVHTGLNNGDVCVYYVTAYKNVNGKPVQSDSSNTLTFVVGTTVNSPIDFTGVAGDGRVTLNWTEVEGAEGYTLHFRRNGGAWQKINLSEPGFEHIGLNNGDRYEYYVTAYQTINGQTAEGSKSNTLTFTIGDFLEMPRDFNAVTTDGQVALTWSGSVGAQGYVVYAYGNGRSYQFDVTQPSYVHNNLKNGDSWTYYVVAYKTINGIRTYSSPTKSITVSVGVSLNAVIDLIATAGNRQVDLMWSEVEGAEGYVLYLYNSKTMEFEPITVISETEYSHTGLKNGTKYTYMVAPYKTIGGTRYYGEYSMSVSATPSTGSNTDIDNTLSVRGTTPYGISHSEYIDASANHGAFDEPVDVYFTTNKESTEAVKDVLKNYADGLKSFIIYPFDISIYREGTRERVSPNNGYSVTITIPIPDRLIAYRDYITVVHIGDGLEDTDNVDEITLDDASEDWMKTDDGRLEVLPCAIVDIDNVWCVQFVCTSFSPYALVIYKEHITDVSAAGGVIDGSFAGTFNSGVLLFTALPDIMPNDKRLKVVRGGKKRYRIKNVEKLDRQ